MNRITVATFPSRAAADPLQHRLMESGIQAEIHDELRLEKLWFVSKPQTGIRLDVPVQQFEQAHQLLLAWDVADGALRQTIRCPECKSLQVDYPQFTRKSLLPNVMMGISAAVGLVEKEYYCVDCHYTWPREGTKASVLRAHMAPYYFIDGIAQSSEPGIATKIGIMK